MISIYNEPENTAGTIRYIDIPPLEDDSISFIIQGYGIPKESAARWAEICSGSPRVAHVIGWNLANNPDDLLKPPDTVNVWNKYMMAVTMLPPSKFNSAEPSSHSLPCSSDSVLAL